MITENKKEYFKNYRLKNNDKLKAYQRQKEYPVYRVSQSINTF